MFFANNRWQRTNILKADGFPVGFATIDAEKLATLCQEHAADFCEGGEGGTGNPVPLKQKKIYAEKQWQFGGRKQGLFQSNMSGAVSFAGG